MVCLKTRERWTPTCLVGMFQASPLCIAVRNHSISILFSFVFVLFFLVFHFIITNYCISLILFPIFFFFGICSCLSFLFLYSCYWMVWTAFRGASVFNSDVSKWAVSRVTIMECSTCQFQMFVSFFFALVFIVFH